MSKKPTRAQRKQQTVKAVKAGVKPPQKPVKASAALERMRVKDVDRSRDERDDDDRESESDGGREPFAKQSQKKPSTPLMIAGGLVVAAVAAFAYQSFASKGKANEGVTVIGGSSASSMGAPKSTPPSIATATNDVHVIEPTPDNQNAAPTTSAAASTAPTTAATTKPASTSTTKATATTAKTATAPQTKPATKPKANKPSDDPY